MWLSITAVVKAAPAGHDPVVELHHRLQLADPAQPLLALTLDACGGEVDQRLIDTLVQQQVPATLFVTRRWLDRNPAAAQSLLKHPELFELENHGTWHRPVILGSQRQLYGMHGQIDEAALRDEIEPAAQRIQALSGRKPQYFRGAGAAYDSAGRQMVSALGYRIAGFSLNADAGATLPAAQVAARLLAAQPGDVVIAHMNHPASGTAAGFAQALPLLRQRGVVFVKLSQASLVQQAGLKVQRALRFVPPPMPAASAVASAATSAATSAARLASTAAAPAGPGSAAAPTPRPRP